MESTLFEINLKNGAAYYVYCANKNQKQRLGLAMTEIRNNIKSWGVVKNGITQINDFEKIVKNYKK